ncbi:hypothetical protein HBI88_150360 [Parastagonospora nodorum]|nr:hypothetical protein HBI94_153000 [Parastagonospora nodorum]KAH5841743.1 hypothetical protein HBI93_011830 [Parastagonospora nodorum]KAH5919763.1 hypothetical protein HBI88_150360 [Parastagonospora nodorum]
MTPNALNAVHTNALSAHVSYGKPPSLPSNEATMLSQHRALPLLLHSMKIAQCSGSDRTVAILPSSPSQRTVASPSSTA